MAVSSQIQMKKKSDHSEDVRSAISFVMKGFQVVSLY
jgi:hypothetical protein